MLISNDKHASAHGYSWEAGAAVDVPDHLAAQLLAIKDSGFYDTATGPSTTDAHLARLRAQSAATIGPLLVGHGATKVSEFPTEDVITEDVITEVDPIETVSEVDPQTPEEAPTKAPAKK